MKAILMAGGEGTRLWPISAGCPKPMAALLGRPLLHGTVELLKKYGVREICMTLRTLPAVIMDYFGDGSAFGVRIEYRLETSPLGTAGSVGACRDFAGGEDVLILSGDGVCSFDLARLMDYHREKGAEATLAVVRREEPTQYGLCLTDGAGRITGFREKPRWEEVVTDLVNTGVYVLSPAALARIPEGRAYDFGKELFPAMLREGCGLYAFEAEGYWCDVGSPEAYRLCSLELAGEAVSEDSLASPTARLSGSVLTAGSVAEGETSITASVLTGARVRRGAVVSRSVLCAGAVVGEGAVLMDGVVLGEQVRVGAGAVLYPGVKVGPGAVIPAGSWVREDVAGAGEQSPLTVSEALRWGLRMGRKGAVSVGWQGGNAAAALAQAFSCGVRAAGGASLAADCAFAAVLGHVAARFSEGRGVFFRQTGGLVAAEVFGQQRGGRGDPAPEEKCGALRHLRGTGRIYLTALTEAGGGEGALAGLRVLVRGAGAANDALRQALAVLGAGEGEGVAFSVSEDGLGLSAWDEGGVPVPGEAMPGEDGCFRAVVLLRRLHEEKTTLRALLG
ncbi:MAG: sugar phosphate nucleotidyltransferase, partial [bacterium]